MPRRTRSSTQTTALRSKIRRPAVGEEAPTLALTPVEIESLVQAAPGEASELPADADTPTIESVRLALGSSSLAASAVHGDAAAPRDPASTLSDPGHPGPAASAEPACAQREAAWGPRRTRETLRADAFQPLRPGGRKR